MRGYSDFTLYNLLMYKNALVRSSVWFLTPQYWEGERLAAELTPNWDERWTPRAY